MPSWRVAAYRAIRPLLFLTDAERIHQVTLALLGSAPGRMLAPIASGVRDPAASPVEVMGLRFRNRIGLAAGFDKDGIAIEGWAALGLGFVELGTVTPRPQPGNPRPRVFRLPHDEALINRMGFNNAGADALARRIEAARPRLPEGFAIGVNVGRNRDTPNADAIADYVAAARALAGVADYIAINVSSPNTPGLRQLQTPHQIRAIVEAVADVARDRPLLVKLSPDMSLAERSSLLAAVSGAPVAGLIVSNTTVARPVRSRRLAQEAGGLSGRPLLRWTLTAVGRTASRTPAVVASGGVGSGRDAAALVSAGADLVQLWTGMVYGGPGVIGEAVRASSGGSGRPSEAC